MTGLEGASTAAGHAFDRPKMDEILSALGDRVFVMNNVHEDQPVVFQTRWALSYLRGPLTREQIQALMASRKQKQTAGGSFQSVGSSSAPGGIPQAALVPSAGARPVVPPDVPEFFVPRRDRFEGAETLQYRPFLLGVARLHYTDKKAGVDYWETVAMLQQVDNALPAEVWSKSEPFDDRVPELDKAPEAGAHFAPLPNELARAKNYAEWSKSLKNYLYRERTLQVYRCSELKQWSRAEEPERRIPFAVGSGVA